MKIFLLIALFLFVSCSKYDGKGTNCEQYELWETMAWCYKDQSKILEKEVEVLKVKMEYGCKELREVK